jgi:hypothetical protein
MTWKFRLVTVVSQTIGSGSAMLSRAYFIHYAFSCCPLLLLLRPDTITATNSAGTRANLEVRVSCLETAQHNLYKLMPVASFHYSIALLPTVNLSWVNTLLDMNILQDKISWTFLLAYSKAKLKSSGDKASPCFRPFWLGKLSDKCVPIRTLYTFRLNTF